MMGSYGGLNECVMQATQFTCGLKLARLQPSPPDVIQQASQLQLTCGLERSLISQQLKES
jgi:hypothetical protein